MESLHINKAPSFFRKSDQETQKTQILKSEQQFRNPRILKSEEILSTKCNRKRKSLKTQERTFLKGTPFLALQMQTRKQTSKFMLIGNSYFKTWRASIFSLSLSLLSLPQIHTRNWHIHTQNTVDFLLWPCRLKRLNWRLQLDPLSLVSTQPGLLCRFCSH